VSDVVELINARLDAMEAAAKAATPGGWVGPIGTAVLANEGAGPKVAKCTPLGYDVTRANATHIALNDPATVLAMVAGIRAVVAIHWDIDGLCSECFGADGVEWPCPTLLALATAPEATP